MGERSTAESARRPWAGPPLQRDTSPDDTQPLRNGRASPNGRAPVETPDARTAGDAGAWRRLWPHLRGGLTAVLLWAALRAIGLWALHHYAAPRGLTLPSLLTRADGDWYMVLAQRGYDQAVPLAADGGAAATNLAFFPLYPGLVALVAGWVPGDIQAVQVVIACATGVAAAAGLYAIGAHLHGPRAGVFLAGLWGALPHAVVETMGYSESLFTALSAWSLWAVLRRRWLTAGLLCVLAGLTRPTALALIAAVVLAALVAAVRDPRQWRAWLAIALAPLGTLGFVLWLNDRLGRWDAYFYVQREAWHNSFDFGAESWRTAGTLLQDGVPLPIVVTTVVLLAMVGLFVASLGARLPWPLLVYSAVVLVLAVGGDAYYWAKARMLLPAFPLLLPAALGMARSRNHAVGVAVLGVLTVIASWYGIFLLIHWRGSP
jgi:hypothetical protein